MPDAEEPIEPGEAAGQAVAGSVAAAAIGLITLGEAAGGVGQIIGGSIGGTTAPSEPFIDPYDQTPLDVDPETGMVWWPWDGGEGRWVDAAVVPGLIEAWDRELDAETARRGRPAGRTSRPGLGRLRRTTREQTRAELDRLAAERARRDQEIVVADRIRDVAGPLSSPVEHHRPGHHSELVWSRLSSLRSVNVRRRRTR